jgi:hypothetical protein
MLTKSGTRGLAVWPLAALLCAGCAGTRNVGLAPEPQVDIDPSVLANFQEEVQEYVALRKRLAGQVPPLPPQSTPEQIAAHQQAFKQAIQQARRGAARGDFFKKKVEAAIRRIIQKEMRGPDHAPIVKEIQQGNPKLEGVPKESNPKAEAKEPVALRVNGDYPDEAPLSSVPPTLLLKLPQLPEEVKYRFVGRHLILRDTEANVILDFIWDAVPDRSLPR